MPGNNNIAVILLIAAILVLVVGVAATFFYSPSIGYSTAKVAEPSYASGVVSVNVLQPEEGASP